MDCYEGATMIKSYKGRLADGGQDRIMLRTNRGDIGYRIVKFQIIPEAPGTVDYESGVSIWKMEQPTVSTSVLNIDFTDGELLGGAYTTQFAASTQGNSPGSTIIFDNEIFNQNIYITHTNVEGSGAAGNMNYYLELEQVKLNDNQSAMATLQSIRQIAEPGNPF